MDLPKEEPNRGMWVEWDNIPRCEGWNFPQNTKQGFGEQCNLRSKYRLKDKFDKTERFLCPFHLKTIGRLHYYYIEELEHKTIIRRETRLSWQKIQKDEIDKKRKIRNAKAKKDKKKKKKKKKYMPMPFQNSETPIIRGAGGPTVYPKENSDSV